MISFILNDRKYTTDLPAGAVTLDLLRNEAGLSGAKEGCREGDCGACTVLLGTLKQQGIQYLAVNSCILPVGELNGRHLVTIEGVSPPGYLSPVQKAFVDEGASQCGFCTPGFIMSLTGYFLGTVNPDRTEAVVSMSGNLCRCTGYVSVRKAAASIFELAGNSPADCPHSRGHLEWLVSRNILPDWFPGIMEDLQELDNGETTLSDMHSPEDTVTVAGGTDLFAVEAAKLRNSGLRFLTGDTKFSGISVSDSNIVIRAASTVSEILSSGIFRDAGNLERSFQLVSSTQVRNRATIGGNIVNASPIGDLAIIFLSLDARLRIIKGNEMREVRLKDFFKGYKILDLAQGELLQSVVFSVPDSETGYNFEKVGIRKHLDIASVNTAAAFRIKNGIIQTADISAGGIAPIPLYLQQTSNTLRGKKISCDTVKMAVSSACSEVTPIDDVRGSAIYKKLLLGRLITAHFLQLFPDMIDAGELL